MNDFELSPDAEEETHVVYRDFLMLIVGSFMILMIAMVFQLNEKAKKDDQGKTQAGTLLVEAFWDDTLNADVDLWVQAPGDVPVGYSNKGGNIFNLLRDDLGTDNDISGRNFEISQTHGLAPGEYKINLHMYRGFGVTYPLSVRIVVSVKVKEKDDLKQIFGAVGKLKKEGEEITVVRFKIDELGNVIPGSMNAIPVPLRSAAKL